MNEDNQNQENRPEDLLSRERVPDKQIVLTRPKRALISRSAGWLIFFLVVIGIIIFMFAALPGLGSEVQQSVNSKVQTYSGSTSNGRSPTLDSNAIADYFSNMETILIVLAISVVVTGLSTFVSLLVLSSISADLSIIRKSIDDRYE